jgi:D-sorbitol dehydrogenase (acceptor)
MRLHGKRALVTGGARGIGLAFAQAYAREGAQVTIADIDEAAAKDAARQLDGDHLGLRMDVTDQASIGDAVAGPTPGAASTSC